MLGFIKLLSPSMWVIVAFAVALGIQTLRLSWAQTTVAELGGEIKECNLKVSIQNDSIARWKLESDRQAKIVAQSAVDARSASQRWQARLDAAQSDRPAVKPSDGPLALCDGSMRWLLDRDNKLNGELNDAK